MQKIIPPFNKWVKMSDKERLRAALTWDMQAGDGKALAEEALKRFKEKYGHIREMLIEEQLGIPVADIWAINVQQSPTFDSKKLPETFLGFGVRYYIADKGCSSKFRNR